MAYVNDAAAVAAGPFDMAAAAADIRAAAASAPGCVVCDLLFFDKCR